MSQSLSPKQKELYQRVDEVLHYLWDPIGVAGEPFSRDEYYGYLPHVFSLLLNTNNGKDITDYLMDVESNSMGLLASKKRTEEVVGILIQWKEKIFAEP